MTLSNIIRNALLTSAVAVCLAAPEGVCAQSYRDGVRIAWDYRTQTFASPGGYARAKLLKPGVLVLVYSNAGGMYIRRYNYDSGTWGSPVLVAKDTTGTYDYTNAELTQLADGKLIYSWNARPLSGTNAPYLIKVKYSTTDGSSWKNEQTVYTAGTEFHDGCWEPSVLQLPSGEVQLFFSNEHNVDNDRQNITMLRSFDDCATWQSPEIISFRSISRDGMPVGVCLQNGMGTAVAIEDNGYNGTFKPVIVWTADDDNWKSGTVDGSSSNRWGALATTDTLSTMSYAGAPYLIQLSSGETLLSVQSGVGRKDSSTHEHSLMQVYVGSAAAKAFVAKSTPWPFIDNGDARTLWNSLCQIDDSTVMAASEIAFLPNNNGVWTVKGKILHPLTSYYAAESGPSSIFIGSQTQAGATVTSSWAEDSLRFTFNVNDRYICGCDPGANPWDADGVEMYLDMKKQGCSSIRTGIYKILVNVDGTKHCSRGATNKWNDWDAPIGYSVSRTSATNYTIKIAIPWRAIKGKPSTRDFCVFFKLHNRDAGSTTIAHENMSGSDPEKPYTWMRCTMEGKPTGNSRVKALHRGARMATSMPPDDTLSWRLGRRNSKAAERHLYYSEQVNSDL